MIPWARKHIFLIAFIILSATIVVAGITAYQRIERQKTPELLPTHALGNTNDYHQYIYLLKLGREGHILYHNAYSEETIPDVLLQPIYNIAGFLSRPFPVSLYAVYFAFQTVSLIFLFFCIYLLITKIFQRTSSRLFAAILFFTATGFWYITSFSPLIMHSFTLVDYDFDLFLKYHAIPPHHNIALALIILIFLCLTDGKKRSLTAAGIMAFLLALIHPYILAMLLFMLFVNAAVETIIEKKIYNRATKDFIFILLWAIPPLAYQYYLIWFLLRFRTGVDGVLSFLPRSISWHDYLEALGPIFFAAIPSVLLFAQLKKYSLTRFLFLWAFVPILFFFFPDFHLPFAVWRLFQIYQHIPLAMLTTLWIVRMINPKSLKITIMIIATIGATTYGILAYTERLNEITLPGGLSAHFNYFIPKELTDVYQFLDTNTPSDSVVIASEWVSNMIPSLTHNRVVIGHLGNNRNYNMKLWEVEHFFSGTLSSDDVRSFLKEHNVSYIIFGFDAPTFIQTSYASLPFLHVIYGDQADVSVVAVSR